MSINEWFSTPSARSVWEVKISTNRGIRKQGVSLNQGANILK